MWSTSRNGEFTSNHAGARDDDDGEQHEHDAQPAPALLARDRDAPGPDPRIDRRTANRAGLGFGHFRDRDGVVPDRPDLRVEGVEGVEIDFVTVQYFDVVAFFERGQLDDVGGAALLPNVEVVIGGLHRSPPVGR